MPSDPFPLLPTQESIGRMEIFGSLGHIGGELHGYEPDPNLVMELCFLLCLRC